MRRSIIVLIVFFLLLGHFLFSNLVQAWPTNFIVNKSPNCTADDFNCGSDLLVSCGFNACAGMVLCNEKIVTYSNDAPIGFPFAVNCANTPGTGFSDFSSADFIKAKEYNLVYISVITIVSLAAFIVTRRFDRRHR